MFIYQRVISHEGIDITIVLFFGHCHCQSGFEGINLWTPRDFFASEPSWCCGASHFDPYIAS